MKNMMSTKKSFSNILIAASLGVCMSGAIAVEPKPHSDGAAATIVDAATTTQVKGKLMGVEGLKHSDISVTTTNGVVSLDGSASSTDAKELAETTAKQAENVKSVDNNLKTPNSSPAVAETEQVVSDSWITTQVKSDLLANSVAKGLDVNVETTNGVVVLKGSLANIDAIEIVKGVAAKVKGVKSVDITGLTIAAK